MWNNGSKNLLTILKHPCYNGTHQGLYGLAAATGIYTTKNITKVVVPKETTIYEGIAALQNIYDSLGNVIGTLPGGGNQVYVPTVEARWFQ